MALFFINTDATSLGGKSPHNKWFKYGIAFTGGEFKYGKKLGRFSPGDICLVYANGIGLVGKGIVTELWDKITYNDPVVYVEPFKDNEYRIKVNWTNDFNSKPISCRAIKNELGWNPSSAVQEIKRKDDIKGIEKLIKRNC